MARGNLRSFYRTAPFRRYTRAVKLPPAVKAWCLIGLALAARLPAATDSVQDPAAEAAGDSLYSPDPQHLWNRLHAAFYQREVETTAKGQRLSLGPDVLDPPLGVHPRYLLDDPPFAKCDAVLDEFLAAHGEKNFTDPLTRALLQRDLWAVFDLLQTERETTERNFGEISPAVTPVHREHRATLSRKVARVIAALALSRAELEGLPDTYAQAVKAGAFPGDAAVTAGQSKADYLPADLFAENSPWIEVTGGEGLLQHTVAVDGRSVFRVFYRPPVAPEGAAKFAAWVIERRKFKPAGDLDPLAPEWEALRQSIPLGTQFLLLREMIEIDEQWNLVPTRIVESVQVRVYRPSPPVPAAEADRPDTPADNGAALLALSSQLYEEFELDRRSLFRGERGGLKATPGNAPRLMGYTALGRLAVNQEGRALEPAPFAFNCLVCHLDPRSSPAKEHPPMFFPSLYQATQLRPFPWDSTATNRTLRWKAEHESFRRLRELGSGMD